MLWHRRLDGNLETLRGQVPIFVRCQKRKALERGMYRRPKLLANLRRSARRAGTVGSSRCRADDVRRPRRHTLVITPSEHLFDPEPAL